MKNHLHLEKDTLNHLAGVPELKRRTVLKSLFATSMISLAGPFAGALSGCADAVSSKKISSFSLAVLPDTQFYDRYASEKAGELYQKNYPSIAPEYDNPFKTQTQWIVANQTRLNIPFTCHLGDVVDVYSYYSSEGSSPWTTTTDLIGKDQLTNGTVVKEWELSSQAMQVLENASCPYSICAGNHDVTSMGPDFSGNNYDGYQDGGSYRQGTQPYLQVFPTARASKQSTFGGRHSSGFHEYHIFTAEGNQFLVLSMSWRASDDAIAWANQVIKSNPTLPVILINHQLVTIGSDGATAADTVYSQYLWTNLINNNDQIFMAVNGHYHGSCTTTKTNAAGNDVFLMVVDYQMAYMGGNGLMRMYEFDLTNSKILATSFSPWVPLKPTSNLNQFDVAWLTDSNQQFTLDIDFKKRFSGFNSAFKILEGKYSQQLSDVAKQTILANYTQPAEVSYTTAKNANDYPVVDGTLAHWRFYNANAKDGDLFSPYQAGQVIADSSPNAANPISLMTWMQGKSGDLVWSTDHHAASSAPGSLKFLNSTKTHANYFVTAQNAPLNVELFPNGYTVEAFVKIASNFDPTINAWMGILYRLGPNWSFGPLSGDDTDGGDCPMMFAVSNLLEFQWETASASGWPPVTATCWSGGVSAGQWMHVAIVNDPTAGTTTMYVEGAPVLRNAHVAGVRYINSQQQMCVGCSQYGGNMDKGFIGSLGEIRIVNKPLTSSQWLTARAS
jgi:hypothetical protein